MNRFYTPFSLRVWRNYMESVEPNQSSYPSKCLERGEPLLTSGVLLEIRTGHREASYSTAPTVAELPQLRDQS